MKRLSLFALVGLLGFASTPAPLHALTGTSSARAISDDEDSDSDDDSDSDSERRGRKHGKNRRGRDGTGRVSTRASDVCIDRNRDGWCDVVNGRNGTVIRNRRDRRPTTSPTMGTILGSVMREGLFRAALARGR